MIDLILDLYAKDKSVKEYLDHLISLDDQTYFKDYRSKIKRAFFSKNGSYSLVNGKKAIADFKKIGASDSSLIDLMLYYVECGIEFSKTFGDINEKFYLSLEKTYGDALYLVEKNSLHDHFIERAQKIHISSDRIGWGVFDVLGNYYYEIFPPE